MTYGWSGSAWRPSRDSGAIISDKTYPAIPAQAALADRVAVLIETVGAVWMSGTEALSGPASKRIG
jgi:hypothetical protein